MKTETADSFEIAVPFTTPHDVTFRNIVMLRTSINLQIFALRTRKTWDKKNFKATDIQDIGMAYVNFKKILNIGNPVRFPHRRGLNEVHRKKQQSKQIFSLVGKQPWISLPLTCTFIGQAIRFRYVFGDPLGGNKHVNVHIMY